MIRNLIRTGTAGALGVGAAAGLYLGLVTGAVAVDLNLGRRTRPLGPLQARIRAPRRTVYDVIAQPYLGRQTRATAEKIRILERGTDLVLAAHRTPISGRLVATTVETVRFTEPERVDFRLVRGPVPHVVEAFVLTETADGTMLDYSGEIGADLWALGERWADLVAARWHATVAASLASIATEAERRAGHRGDAEK
jgi:hypothetical protein